MNRYPAPCADEIWSDTYRVKRLRKASDEYTKAALRRGLAGVLPRATVDDLVQTVEDAKDPSVIAWRDAEEQSGHEIVGFLDVYLSRLPETVHPYVHFGLTSSDLVEYDLHRAIADHAAEMVDQVRLLSHHLHNLAAQYEDLPRAGRTHGQIAELTTLGHQFEVFYATLVRVGSALFTASKSRPVKSPGPTGVSQVVLAPWRDVVPSTQVIPRDYLLRWASACLGLVNTLETMAMFVRLGSRSEVGELAEGAAAHRVGSSAMPGKRNPIQSERVCGLARVARGHFLALAEASTLWEDRDLSNSSTERLAVPGLAGLTEHMLRTVHDVFIDLVIDETRIRFNSDDRRCRANQDQCDLQSRLHVGPLEASRLATQERTSR